MSSRAKHPSVAAVLLLALSTTFPSTTWAAVAGRLRLLVLDEHGAPQPGIELDVAARGGGTGERFARHHVRSGARGLIEISPVATPCEFYILTQPVGVRIVPDYPRRMVVPVDAVVPIVRQRRHVVLLSPVDRELAAQLSQPEALRSAHLEIVPLEGVEEPLRDDASSVLKTFSESAIAALMERGEAPLGDLPAGRYLITVWTPELGGFARELTVDPRSSVTRLPMRVDAAPSPIEAAVHVGDAPLSGAWVFDGYITPGFARYLIATLPVEPRRVDLPDAAFAMTDQAGRFRLAIQNREARFVTVVAPNDRVYHVDKETLGKGPTALVGHPRDAVLTGVVRDENGAPRPGLLVNVTTRRGGDGTVLQLAPDTIELRDLRTDESGRFWIDGIYPGEYVLSVCVDDPSAPEGSRHLYYLPETLRTIRLHAGTQEVDLVVERSTELPPACDAGDHHGHAPHDGT